MCTESIASNKEGLRIRIKINFIYPQREIYTSQQRTPHNIFFISLVLKSAVFTNLFKLHLFYLQQFACFHGTLCTTFSQIDSELLTGQVSHIKATICTLDPPPYKLV